MELLKQVFEGSNRGSLVSGLYGDGVFVGKITNDVITRAPAKSRLDQKQAENDALIQTNSELVRTNSELVASNNELNVANNELAKANKKCQTEVGTCNSNFAQLIDRK
ncbi:hypothetical protein POM88_052324 [Heracleum sosnowskyi]|uniref:Uncharacterized protein n=1 Tax=Heracleum sosnowskyi TaxID=360622 RepID=A0AAD8GS15_9APIA|nr:hypothetical protein POM88_052324 [Heracleum sosnowskyi]